MSAKISLSLDEGWVETNPILLLLFNIVGILFCFICKRGKNMPIWGKAFVIFNAFIFLISFYHCFFHSSHGFIKTTLACSLPLVSFFVQYYAQQDENLQKLTKSIALICFVFFVLGYIRSFFSQTQFFGESFVENNESYFLLYFLPFITIAYKKDDAILRYFIIATALAIFISMKRGGILGITAGIGMFLYLRSRIANKSRFGLKPIILILLLGAFFYMVDSQMGGIVFERFEGLSDDGGTGRDLIWAEGVVLIASSSISGKLIGHGFNSAREVTALSVSLHNDYLEIIYDFGWIGFSLFLFFVFSLIVFVIKNKTEQSTPSLGMAITILLVLGVVSHIVIYNEFFILFSLCFGAGCGDYSYRTRRDVIK